MAYLDYPGLAYFKSLLDENYLRTNYEGDTVINGNVTFTNPVDASVKNDWLGQQIDKTYLKDVVPDPEGSGALALILGDGSVSHLITDTTVTQVRSNANELYPILLCYDASAEEDQIAKKVWYGNGVRINPRYGYLYSQKMFTLHPTYNRAAAPTSRVEWTNDFRDSVLNPVGQIFEYIDPVSQGGEHRMELRLYGNPNVAGINTPNVNYETNTVSLGVSATRGDALTFFGYAPSTPIYLEDGSTMRKSLVRGDQYGKDIITRDWLNLNGSITGLVHTYMDETIDGYKTFLKTVTIDSGNDNAKAGLNVQGDVNIDSGDASKPSNFYVQGNSHIHGNEDIDGNLNVDGTSDQHGNVHMYHNLDVDGNANTDGNQTIGGTLTVTGKITGNGGAEISGGSGLKVNGNETITGNLTVGGTTTTEDLTVNDDATIGDDLTVNGDELVKGNETVNGNSNVGGTINKVSGNTTQEYVTYITSQPTTREAISQNLLALGKGLAKDSQGKIYVDFSQIDNNTKAAILAGLDIQVPIKSNITLTVNPGANNDTDSFDLPYETRKSTPFTTISKAVEWASSKLALGTKNVYIDVYAGTYPESVGLPEVNCSSGHIIIQSHSGNKDVIVQPPYRANGLCNAGFYAGYGACKWTLKHMTVDMRLQACSTAGNTTSGIAAAVDGAIVELFGCTVKALPTSNTITGESYGVRMIEAALGGKVFLYPDDKGSELIFDLPTTNTAGIAIYPINVTRQGVITWCRSDNSTNGHYYCQGSCTTFFDAWQSGSMQTRGAVGPEITFDVASGHTVTGKKYAVRSGSFAILPTGGFPGSIDGTVEDSTYSWVS